jgi:Mg-chelatase subunit ChlI
MKSVLLRLDDKLAERLELMNRVLGGAGTRGGKKSAIVRCALAQLLPDEQQLKEIIKYNRSPLRKKWTSQRKPALFMRSNSGYEVKT